ncbi:MAG: TonB-dependent receptor plug domain-containing protein, partial [Gammaproteobacteria bacterium]|nr:TonB-dependent receptor plug domain-containing protein [Gammaproteobacteria bacterium]
MALTAPTMCRWMRPVSSAWSLGSVGEVSRTLRLVIPATGVGGAPAGTHGRSGTAHALLAVVVYSVSCLNGAGRASRHQIVGGKLTTMRIFVAAGLVVLALPQVVMGQGADQPVLEEILVTATKREASIQDVPIAVSAYSGEELAGRGVTDLYGLQEVSPSVAVYNSNSTSNGGTLRIRGVGTTGNNPGL